MNTDCPNAYNGYCNDESNIAECNYDGGDCCGPCVITNHCSECACLGGLAGAGAIGNDFCDDEINNADCNYDGGDCCPTPDLIANGFCDDETNHEICLFDGLDCCGSLVNQEHCSSCTCHSMYFFYSYDGHFIKKKLFSNYWS